MTETPNYHFAFACGCNYDHQGGDTYCADHTWNGQGSADNPATARRWQNITDDEAFARWQAKQSA